MKYTSQEMWLFPHKKLQTVICMFLHRCLCTSEYFHLHPCQMWFALFIFNHQFSRNELSNCYSLSSSEITILRLTPCFPWLCNNFTISPECLLKLLLSHMTHRESTKILTMKERMKPVVLITRQGGTYNINRTKLWIYFVDTVLQISVLV